MVNFVFPNKVLHLTNICKQEEILFKTFLAEHFQLGGECPNPRLVLLFLNYTLEEAVAYYDRNPDPACRYLQPNEFGEYELILKEHLLRGFRKLQFTAKETVVQLSLQWRPFVARLFAAVGSPQQCVGLSIEKLKELTGWDGEAEEFHRFVAFYTHVGLLVPANEEAQFNDRTFSLPTVMRICPQQPVKLQSVNGK